MAALAEHSNVYDTALKIIIKKGFRVWLEVKSHLYCAEKDGWDFKSDSPCGLLGLIAIYEYRQPTSFHDYWWKEEGPGIYRSLTTDAPDYIPVYERHGDGPIAQ